eukprot:PhF_6_TR19772/c0_g1_i2/m.28839/K08498/STX6; syntaxin 6
MSGLQVLQGEVIRCINICQSSLRVLQQPSSSPSVIEENTKVFNVHLNEAKDLLAEMQGKVNTMSSDAKSTMVSWITSSVKNILTMEETYSQCMRGFANSTVLSSSNIPKNNNHTNNNTHDMMLRQHEMMREQQDEGLELIEQGVGRLKQTAALINDELTQQKTMLDKLSDEVDETRDKLKMATKKLDKLMTEMSDRGKVCCIVVLMFILGAMIAILIAT